MKNRKCRNCENIIPSQITINNKRINLGNRKFCLNCSPLFGHNTKKDITKPSSSHNQPYSEWTEEYKDFFNAINHKKRVLRKKKLIDISGGKCIKCGYNKCDRCLTFHHRNPKEKEFNLDQRSIQTKNWDLILQELKKCDLLCHNCHMEIESENTKFGKYEKILIERYGKEWDKIIN